MHEDRDKALPPQQSTAGNTNPKTTAVPGPEGAGLLAGTSLLPLWILPFSVVRRVRAVPQSVCLQGMRIHCSSGHGQQELKGLSLLSLHKTEAPERHGFPNYLRSQTEAVSSSQHPAQDAHIIPDKLEYYLSTLLSLPLILPFIRFIFFHPSSCYIWSGNSCQENG